MAQDYTVSDKQDTVLVILVTQLGSLSVLVSWLNNSSTGMWHHSIHPKVVSKIKFLNEPIPTGKQKHQPILF